MNKVGWLSVIVALGAILYVAVPMALHCNKTCMVNCILFNTDFIYPRECLDYCECGLLVKILPKPKTPPSHPVSMKSKMYMDREEDCPNGHAPTPVVPMKKEFENASSKPKQPNIFLFLFDDLDEVVSPYWEVMTFSKKLFLQNGTMYSNAFAQSSICCPARCQILTGLMGHNTGVLENNGMHGGLEAFIKPYFKNQRIRDSEGRCIDNEQRTIPLFLSEYANYRSSIIGKYLNGIENTDLNILDHVPPGWTDIALASTHRFYNGFGYALGFWKKGQDQVTYKWYGNEESDYSTDVCRDEVVNYIDYHRQGTSKQPLFSYICSTAPHFPILPAQRHHNQTLYWYNQYDKYVSNRANFFNQTEVAQKSRWMRQSMAWRTRGEWMLHIEFGKRMASLYALDEMIEGVYRKIEALGELDNTVFIMSSDNGYNMGAHGLLHKMSPYEEASKVPLYISGPGFGKGKVVDDLVLLTDLAPTILDLAGLEIPQYFDSFSLLKNTKRDIIFMQYKEEEDPISHTMKAHENETVDAALRCPDGFAQDPAPWKAIRTQSLAYICYYMLPYRTYNIQKLEDMASFTVDQVDLSVLERECELYDMKKDPEQMNNIVKNVDSDTIQKLDDALNALSRCAGKNCYDIKINVKLP